MSKSSLLLSNNPFTFQSLTTRPADPIFHDDSDGAVRFVESVWPHKTYPILYGSVPQTWEDPNFDHEYTGFPGDNDPVDFFDVSGIDEGYVGQVKQVKILGALAMVDVSRTLLQRLL